MMNDAYQEINIDKVLDFVNSEIDTDIERYAQSMGVTSAALLEKAKKQLAPMVSMMSRQELEDLYLSMVSEYIASAVDGE